MFSVQLSSINTLSESTREFRFARTDGEKLEYQPGQFYRFVFEDESGEFERSYSLCNYQTLYGSDLDLVVSKVDGGRATRLLFDAEIGLSAKVTGPFGRLVLPADTARHVTMVATSVGLAPFMPMLAQLDRQWSEGSTDYPQVTLLLGVRDRTEFLYGDWLLELAARHAHFEVQFCLSRETADATRRYEVGGYVTPLLMTKTVDLVTDHFLLCGNPAMVEDCWQYLKSLGVRPKSAIREKYVFAVEKKIPPKPLDQSQKDLIAAKLEKYRR